MHPFSLETLTCPFGEDILNYIAVWILDFPNQSPGFIFSIIFSIMCFYSILGDFQLLLHFKFLLEYFLFPDMLFNLLTKYYFFSLFFLFLALYFCFMEITSFLISLRMFIIVPFFPLNILLPVRSPFPPSGFLFPVWLFTFLFWSMSVLIEAFFAIWWC